MRAPIDRFAIPALVAGILSGLCLPFAVAQTPPRYAMRDLPKPAGADYCAGSTLNEGGDAALLCTYKGGTRMETQYLFCLPFTRCLITYQAKRTWFYNVPVVVRHDGSQRVLTTTERTNAYNARLTNTGDLHADIQQLDANGYNIVADGGPARIWRATANQAEAFPAMVVDGETYFVAQVRPSGRMLWQTWDAKRVIATRPDGTIQPLPEVPPEFGTVDGESGVAINDHGMVLRATWMKTSPTPENPYGNPTAKSMFYDGQKWVVVKMPAVGSMGGGAQSLNAKGQFVAHDVNLTRYFWQPSQPEVLLTLPGAPIASEPLVINDAGVIGGGIPIAGDRNGRSKATIWVSGQPVDLNTLTSNMPRGWQLQMVKAINGKGQLLVNAVDTTRSSAVDNIKTVLLTPH